MESDSLDWHLSFFVYVQYLSQTMRNLADKAFELSKKHNLKDEVKMIQEEERKLEQYLQLESSKGEKHVFTDNARGSQRQQQPIYQKSVI